MQHRLMQKPPSTTQTNDGPLKYNTDQHHPSNTTQINDKALKYNAESHKYNKDQY